MDLKRRKLDDGRGGRDGERGERDRDWQDRGRPGPRFGPGRGGRDGPRDGGRDNLPEMHRGRTMQGGQHAGQGGRFGWSDRRDNMRTRDGREALQGGFGRDKGPPLYPQQRRGNNFTPMGDRREYSRRHDEWGVSPMSGPPPMYGNNFMPRLDSPAGRNMGFRRGHRDRMGPPYDRMPHRRGRDGHRNHRDMPQRMDHRQHPPPHGRQGDYWDKQGNSQALAPPEQKPGNRESSKAAPIDNQSAQGEEGKGGKSGAAEEEGEKKVAEPKRFYTLSNALTNLGVSPELAGPDLAEEVANATGIPLRTRGPMRTKTQEQADMEGRSCMLVVGVPQPLQQTSIVKTLKHLCDYFELVRPPPPKPSVSNELVKLHAALL